MVQNVPSLSVANRFVVKICEQRSVVSDIT